MNRRMYSMLLAVGLCASAQDKKLEFDVASVRVASTEQPGVFRKRFARVERGVSNNRRVEPPGFELAANMWITSG